MTSVGTGRTWYHADAPIPEIDAERGDLIMINRRRAKLYVCHRHSAEAYGLLLANLDKGHNVGRPGRASRQPSEVGVGSMRKLRWLGGSPKKLRLIVCLPPGPLVLCPLSPLQVSRRAQSSPGAA